MPDNRLENRFYWASSMLYWCLRRNLTSRFNLSHPGGGNTEGVTFQARETIYNSHYHKLGKARKGNKEARDPRIKRAARGRAAQYEVGDPGELGYLCLVVDPPTLSAGQEVWAQFSMLCRHPVNFLPGGPMGEGVTQAGIVTGSPGRW